MPASDSLEERTRVILTLPYTFRPELSDPKSPEYERRQNLLVAFARVMDRVRAVASSENGLTGYTVSHGVAYSGAWVMTTGPKAGTWEDDDVRLLVLDFSLPLAGNTMRELLLDLRRAVVEAYFFGPSDYQDDVWVVAFPLFRQKRTQEETDWLLERGVALDGPTSISDSG